MAKSTGLAEVTARHVGADILVVKLAHGGDYCPVSDRTDSPTPCTTQDWTKRRETPESNIVDCPYRILHQTKSAPGYPCFFFNTLCDILFRQIQADAIAAHMIAIDAG